MTFLRYVGKNLVLRLPVESPPFNDPGPRWITSVKADTPLGIVICEFSV